MNHFISNHFASAHWASAHFAGEAVEVIEPPIVTPGTGGGGGYAVKRTYEEKPDYEKLKRERFIAQAREEDEIAVAIITLLLTQEFFE